MINNPSDGTVFVKGVIQSVFNGCAQTQMPIKIATANESAACGAALPTDNNMWIFFGSFVNTTQTLYVTSCSFFAPFGSLTADNLSFLHAMKNDCTGQCFPGVPLTHCFVEPCQVSSCSVDDAVCEDSYCGGCFAFWFSPNNTRVCFHDQTRSCISSGGSVMSGMCCKGASDFPNSCSIGACSCSPSNSKVVQKCQCPPGSCFDGSACVHQKL